jgi:NADH-ubiquinone oxidoreductase chain 1
MTEHAAVIFVFFFLAEYGSIVLICILNTVLFLGGYLLDFSFIIAFIDYVIDIIAFLLEAVAISALPRLPE